MRYRAVFPLLIVSALTIFSTSASALDQITGHITFLEPTYMPGRFVFQLDSGTANCPAGKWLTWINSDAANVRAVYATALSAIVARSKINFFVESGDTICNGKYMHLRND
jgi:hypothetical protein